MPVTPRMFRVRRLGSWVPPAVFLALNALILAGAPDLGTRLIYMGFTLLNGLWLVRCLRLSVETTQEEVIVRTSVWTHRYDWDEVVKATVVPMPTRSPFATRVPYVALGLHLRDGRTRRFSDISSNASSPKSISAIVDHINEHGRPAQGGSDSPQT